MGDERTDELTSKQHVCWLTPLYCPDRPTDSVLIRGLVVNTYSSCSVADKYEHV